MSSPFPDEIEEDMAFTEVGNHGCLLPDNDTDDGHCDAEDEEDDE